MSAFLLVPLAGFLGSFHCVAMCGPFVGFYALSGRGHRGYRHVAYHLGRLVSYVSLGLVVGWFGQALLYFGSLLQVQRILIVALGVIMMLLGLAHYLPGKSRFVGFGAKISGYSRRLLGRNPSVAQVGLFGMLTTLLPCGFLYSFVFAAGASGHPVSGFLIMFGFWLGTVPLLLGMGWCVGGLGSKFANTLSHLTPICLIAFGILAILGKWQAFPNMALSPDQFCPG